MPALIVAPYFSLLILSLLDNLRGPFFPELIQSLELSATAGSAFFAMTNLFSFLGSWLSHRVLRRHTSVQLMSVASFIVALGYAAISFSPRFGWLMVSCMVFGLAYGALNLAQNVMVFEGSTPRRRRQMFNGLHAMYGLASLAAPLLASAFIENGFSWRQSFLVMAVVPLFTPLLLRGVKAKPPPREKPAEPLARSEWLYCAIFSTMMAGYLWGELSLVSRMVLWLRADHGFSPERANFFLSAFFLCLLGGRALFTVVHFERLGNWRILTVSAGLSALCYGLALYVAPFWMVICGLALAPFFPTAMEQVSRLFPEKSAQALGFIIGFGSLSVVVMHMTVGLLTDSFGLTSALMVGPSTLLMVFSALIVAQTAGWLRL